MSIHSVSLASWRRDALARGLIAAGDCAVHEYQWANQARTDAGEQTINWPRGYTRETAIAELRTVLHHARWAPSQATCGSSAR